MLGKEYAEAIVFSFKALKSTTNRHLLLPCESGFFGTIHRGEL